MDFDSKIFVAGHRGLVGSSIIRKLKNEGYNNIITKQKCFLDLTNQSQVEDFFREERPDYVFLAAAKVGGIGYNQISPADFIRENLQIQTNVIDAAYRNGCKKLLFLGSACVYPKHASVPIKEEYLMTGPLEETNSAYSLSKIIGYEMCRKYTTQYGFQTISVMPNNLYGINDNFIVEQSHVIPGLINKFVSAKEKNLPTVTCFGDGSPTREFLFSDDLADALLFLMNNYNDPEIINIGTKREISIKELSEIISNLVGYSGEVVWDTSRPNGTPRRFLDTYKMDSLGWTSQTSLENGLEITIDWFLENRSNYARK
jgi:GDP-L-fucose synthase